MTVTLLLVPACADLPDVAPLAEAITARPVRVEPLLAGTKFGKAVALVVTDSPRVARSAATLQEAEAQLMAERAAVFPDLSFDLLLPVGGSSLAIVPTLTQLAFDAGARGARTRAAEATILGHQAGQIDEGSQAAFEAVDAWAAVVAARRFLTASETAVSGVERVTEQIELRKVAGAGSVADLLTARSRLENERATAAGVRAEVARASAVYSEIFGFPPAEDLDLPPVLPRLSTLDAIGSPTLFTAEAARLAAEAELAEARAARLSPLRLEIGVPDGNNVAASLGTDEIFSPGRERSARVAAMEARLDARTADVEATRREIDRRLAILLAEQQAASERRSSAQRATKANRANVAAAREQFSIARRSLIELLDTEREALAAERLLIEAERDEAVLGYAILATTGDILDLFGIPRSGGAPSALEEPG